MAVQPRGFWASARADPDRVAVIDAGGGTHTAGELVSTADRLVHALRARGLARGDVVATLAPNSPELLATLLAVFQAGYQYVPINTSLTAAEAAHVLADSGARAVVADESRGPVAAEAATIAGVPGAGRFSIGSIPGFMPLDEVVANQPADPPEDRLAGQFLQYTSGTTGRPKAVQRDHAPRDPEDWVATFSANLTRYDIEPGGDGVHLVTSPMYHMAPLSFGFFSMHLEHPVVLMDRFDAEQALALIERHRVTHTHVVPTQLHRLMQLPAEVRGRYDVSSLRQVIHAGAPCPSALKRRVFEWLGPVVYEFYGATEGGGTIARPLEWLAHPGTVGRPWPGADVRVLDDDGNDVPPGEVGTVYLKVMGEFAYKGDPEKTAASRRGEYFTVGDMGTLDDEGFLYLKDRRIDLIIRGGVNIYPAEVEAALLEHPKVGDAAVFGIPDEEWGEQVMAVVEPAPGYAGDPDLVADLDAHCVRTLAAFKRPRTIDLVDALPRDANGKLYKRRLRDPYWAGRERQV